jgi:hypothetical protein
MGKGGKPDDGRCFVKPEVEKRESRRMIIKTGTTNIVMPVPKNGYFGS